MPRLENWSIISGDNFHFLSGNIYEDTRFPDGKWINTSTVVKLDPSARTAKTFSGTLYSLGRPVSAFVHRIHTHHQKSLLSWLTEISKELQQHDQLKKFDVPHS